MFVRPCFRYKDGKRHAYWALVESYRTERGPRQRVVAYLGRLDEAGRLGIHQAAEPQGDRRQQQLFDEPEPRWVEVDAAAVRVENCRRFGDVWLALELIRKLGLNEFLERAIPHGREEVPWSVTALVLVIARLCEPSSELYIAEHFYRQTALSDLLGASVREDRRQPPVPRSGPITPPQSGTGEVPQGAAGRVIRPGIRPALVRRHQHVL